MIKGDVLDFLDLVRSECDAEKIGLTFLPRRGVFGMFDESKRRIEVSIQEHDWLLTLAHEHAHFRQWREGLFPSIWPNDGPVERFEAWMEKKAILTGRGLTSTVRLIQRCELDAERRAVKMIRAYGLTNDLTSYLKRAWCNVMGYEFARRHKTWWTEGLPYPWDVPEISNRIPARLPTVSGLGKIDPTLDHLILAHCCEE